jgi:hypothetical protein
MGLGCALVCAVVVPLMLFVVVKAVTGIRWPNQWR